MLDKLSGALKKTTDKIANAIFLDKNLVDQIVRDLQRALIEADVNVSLVLEISRKIKQAALDERIKGIEKKELYNMEQTPGVCSWSLSLEKRNLRRSTTKSWF